MNTSPETPAPWWRRTLSQLGRDLAYLLVQLPISIAAFVVAITLASVAVGTAVIWVGAPLGALCLVVATWFATLERKRLATVTSTAPVASYIAVPSEASRVRRLIHPYTDPQRWRDLVYAIVDFPVGVFVWSVALVWTALAASGVTAWFWNHYLPENDDGAYIAILDWLNSTSGRTTTGLIALVTLPWVARGLVRIQQGVGTALLSASDAQFLRSEVSRLEAQGKVAASAEAQSLRKIERDLHDGPQQRLIRLAMDVQQAEAALEKDPEGARRALESARVQSADALAELRQLTRGIAPPILVERGLAAALDSLAERGTIPVDVDVTIEDELGAGAETALYFVASESLANVEKHAQATSASILVRAADGEATMTVTDDGVGGAHAAKGHGLAGLADRVEGAGGTLTVADAPGGGTVVTAEVPCG